MNGPKTTPQKTVQLVVAPESARRYTLPRQLGLRELEINDLVELQLAAYPHTDWLVGVDLPWPRRPGSGVAERWLKARLMQSKVFWTPKPGNDAVNCPVWIDAGVWDGLIKNTRFGPVGWGVAAIEFAHRLRKGTGALSLP